MNSSKGILYLIPSPIGAGDVTDVIPAGTMTIIAGIRYFAVEELRSARRYLSKAGLKGHVDKLEFFLLNEHSSLEDAELCIDILLKGSDVGLISEAGLPAVADPGAILVELAHKNRVKVVPLTGPSSLMLALMASGKNGQNFAFSGYLPVRGEERRARIKTLERTVTQTGQSQIFIETPYRNIALMNDIMTVCSDDTTITVASGLTTPAACIRTLSVREWKKEKLEIDKIPCVFII